MKISTNKKELKELRACASGYRKFVEIHGDNEATLSQYLDSNGWGDVWWLISETYNQFSDAQKHDLRVFGCKKALINIEKIKPYCSEEEEEEYKSIVCYLRNPNEKARSAAWSAAWSARASSASSARSAAKAAAWSAAWSAVWSEVWSAAWSAVWSAVWSAWSAADSATWSAVMEENVKNLKTLFLKWEFTDAK